MADPVYVTALERLTRAVESHKEAGFPPCPECDTALAQAHEALVGLRHAHQMREIEDAERQAAVMKDAWLRATPTPSSQPDRTPHDD